jgi:phage gp36-like protein
VNYCSVVDVRNALTAGGATSGTNTAADMDDATLQDAIAEASSVVDTYVGGPYGPSDSVPNMVVYWTRDVAAFLATCTWRQSKDFEALDPVLLRYQQAVERLAGIFTGTTSMPSSQMPTQDVFTGAVCNTIPITLFHASDFDLYGRAETSTGEVSPGWPIFTVTKDSQNWQAYQWPGYMF